MSASRNPLLDWELDPDTITTTGTDLRRPECVLAEQSGDLWVADVRGAFVHIHPDGGQDVVIPQQGGPFAPADPVIDGNGGFSLPNGMCFDAAGDIVVANFGTDLVEKISRDGRRSLVLDHIDGRPLGKANFPAIDSHGRLWFTVTASAETWRTRRGEDFAADGYIAVVDERGPRIVAEGLFGTNELRFSLDENWVYVAETAADHITRFRVDDDAALSGREVYGPERLGGNPDGFAFDDFGNLWTTLINRDRLVAITPDGDVRTIWQDGVEAPKDASPAADTSFGRRPTDGLAPHMASVTFGGPDLRTVYVGSLGGSVLPTFRAPVAGMALPHWSRSTTV